MLQLGITTETTAKAGTTVAAADYNIGDTGPAGGLIFYKNLFYVKLAAGAILKLHQVICPAIIMTMVFNGTMEIMMWKQELIFKLTKEFSHEYKYTPGQALNLF